MSADSIFDLAGERVWVTGHRGMVGSAIVRRLQNEPCDVLTAARDEVDLARQEQVESWMGSNAPTVVVHAAGTVGGIHANNSAPATFLYENLALAANVIHAAFGAGVRKLLYLGSSCVYPREAPQPMSEECLLGGPLEPTNEWYAVAKIAGIKLCQAYRRQHGADFISVMPCNLYGPGDNFHPENGHVPAALLRRFHEAKAAGMSEAEVWGTGKPRREFLYVDDLADACAFLLRHYSGEMPINIGTGNDVTIAEFAEEVRRAVGLEGRLVFDPSRPDGMPRKVVDVSRLRELGWSARTPLSSGLERYYEWFLANQSAIRH